MLDRVYSTVHLLDDDFNDVVNIIDTRLPEKGCLSLAICQLHRRIGSGSRSSPLFDNTIQKQYRDCGEREQDDVDIRGGAQPAEHIVAALTQAMNDQT